jgi:NAD(P) transhydrogenase subunit alpha
MTTDLEIGLYIFMLAAFLGYHLISRVPPLLHTPLMSATNAMSGISLIGSIVVAGADYDELSTLFGLIAVTCSSTNVVGGFLITDRMLKMFKSEHDRGSDRGRSMFRRVKLVASAIFVLCLLLLIYWFVKQGNSANPIDPAQALKFFYIISAALFILGLKGLSSPKFARKGMFLAEFGMAMAVVGTLFHHEIVTYNGSPQVLLWDPSLAAPWGCGSR